MTNEQILFEFTKKLTELKPLLDSSDRVECFKETGYSPITIHRYLNGNVSKTQVASNIYQFLKNRIEKRTQLATA